MDTAADVKLAPKFGRKHYIIYALLLVGFFFPSSYHGIQLKICFFIISFLLLASFSFFIKLNRLNIIFFAAANLSLAIFTIWASLWFSEYSFGVYFNFFPFTVLLLTNFRGYPGKRAESIGNFQLMVTWLIIILGVGIILGNDFIDNFLINFYSFAYESLLPNMLAARKPVMTFGTHSVAAFFLFFLFFFNIKTYRVIGRLKYLITSIVVLLLLIFIRSNTALGYSCLAFIILIGTFAKRKSSLFIAGGIIVGIFLYVSVIDPTIIEVFSNYNVLDILTSNSNGLAGRYSNDSVLKPTIDYIIENPLIPVGLTFSKKLYFTDSGFILYLVRGSIFLVFAIYLGFYSFLKNNMIDKPLIKYVFFFFIIFEIGYPMLVDFRVMCFIPFMVIYLNYLKDISAEG